MPQIAAGRGEKAAFAPIRAIGGLARHDQFGFDPLSIGHVPNDGGDQRPLARTVLR